MNKRLSLVHLASTPRDYRDFLPLRTISQHRFTMLIESRLNSGFAPNIGTPLVEACFLYLLRVSPVRTSLISRLSFLIKDRKSTRLNSSHVASSYAVFCLIKKKC